MSDASYSMWSEMVHRKPKRIMGNTTWNHLDDEVPVPEWVPNAAEAHAGKSQDKPTYKDEMIDFTTISPGDWVALKTVDDLGNPFYELHQVDRVSDSKSVITVAGMRFKSDGYLFSTVSRYRVRVVTATEDLRSKAGHNKRAQFLQAVRWQDEDPQIVLDVYYAYERAVKEQV